MLWYLPTFYGDIRLKRLGDMETVVSWEKLTATERKAMEALFEKARAKKWMQETALLAEGSFTVRAPIHTVQKLLAKTLKPTREIIDVVAFKDGTVSEIRGEAEPPAATEKATTVAKPTLGCPEPRLARAELRAREVLFAFTTEEQQADFLARNAFVSIGAATGHRYMITSRHANDELATFRRQLYDLDERRPFCVHDYSVPAAEEMLALHLMLQLPQYEPYLRHLE